MTTIGTADFMAMFTQVNSDAFRFESRRSYALGYERADVEAWLGGETIPDPPALDWYRPYLDNLAAAAVRGIRYSRVRLVDEPRTPYQRFLDWSGQWNQAAGEDIRYLPRVAAAAAGIAEDDWWMFDQATVVRLIFDDATDELDYYDLAPVEDLPSYLRAQSTLLSLTRSAQSQAG